MYDTAVLSRRGFLKSVASATAGAAAACVLPELGTASTSAYRPIRYLLAGNFNATESNIIAQAVSLVANRMLDGRMFLWTRARYRRWFVRVPNRTFANTAAFEAWFVRIQLASLSAVGFPQLTIRSRYEPRGSWVGEASVGRVRTEYYVINGRNVPSVTGSFDITLNTGLLGNAAYHAGRDAAYWAGVITHEMLHNLGHEHPVNVYDGLFIRTYQNAVQCNANPLVRG